MAQRRLFFGRRLTALRTPKPVKVVNETGAFVYFEDTIVPPNGVMEIKKLEEGSRQYSVCVLHGDEQPNGSLRNLEMGEHLVTFNDDAVFVPRTKWCLTLDGLLDERTAHRSPAGGNSSPLAQYTVLAQKLGDRLKSLVKH